MVMKTEGDAIRYPVPPYLGLVLDVANSPVGTCFQVRPGILVTARHVLASIGVERSGSSIMIEPLEGGTQLHAHLLGVDLDNDIAILQSTVYLREAVRCLLTSDSIELGSEVVICGFSQINDRGHEYRYLETTGLWLGGTVRDRAFHLGRARASDVVPGMSGAPVRTPDDDCVIGMIHGRFNSIDGWLRDTVWICRTDDIVRKLEALEIPVLTLPSGKSTAPLRLKARALKGLDSQFTQLYYHIRVSSDPKRLETAIESSERLLLNLNRKIAIGNVGAGSGQSYLLAQSIDALLDELLAQEPNATSLLPLRARTREQLGNWVGALADIQRLADFADLPANVLGQAGSLLMTLGNYRQASQLLAVAERGEVGASEKFQAQILQAWIDDYQGRHDLAIRRLAKIRDKAVRAGVGDVIIGGADHRMARALYEKAVRRSRAPSDDLTRALAIAERGRKRIPDANRSAICGCI